MQRITFFGQLSITVLVHATRTAATNISQSSHHKSMRVSLLANNRRPTVTIGRMKKIVRMTIILGCWLSSSAAVLAAMMLSSCRSDQGLKVDIMRFSEA